MIAQKIILAIMEPKEATNREKENTERQIYSNPVPAIMGGSESRPSFFDVCRYLPLFFIPSLILLAIHCPVYGETRTISAVPDYQQSELRLGDNLCSPTASGCVLGYWDTEPEYEDLITGSNDFNINPDGVRDLIRSLRDNMGWSAETGTPRRNLPGGIEQSASERGYSFYAISDDEVSWMDVKTEIDSNRPFVFSIDHNYYFIPNDPDMSHSVTGVGYTEDSNYHEFNAVEDSYVSSLSSNTNYGFEGSLYAGWWSNSGDFMALVKFDLSSLAARTDIDEATLRVYCNILSGDDNIYIRMVGGDWSEGVVTWNNRPDLGPAAGAIHFTPPGDGQFWEIRVTSMVNAWFTETYEAYKNYGFYLKRDSDQDDTLAVFSSKESGYADWTPRLFIKEWSDRVVIVHDNWDVELFPYDPDVWLNFDECYDATLTRVGPNSAPQLSSGRVDPASGDSNTDFYWYVDYYDADGHEPLTTLIYIDDIAYTMSLNSGSFSNGTYRYGPMKLEVGYHDYYFHFGDGHGGFDRFPDTGMHDGPTVNNCPVLSGGDVDKDSGDTRTVFRYTAHYYDQDGHLPTSAQVVIGDSPHPM
ncbi:MAG: DNRLRE domain-containing protein, partial [Pseudomonadota bacterium]